MSASVRTTGALSQILRTFCRAVPWVRSQDYPHRREGEAAVYL
uniref:Uncharacterized protein n=1 Tax=Anguilla anguilla TaxID=7936 RepID=A0A0E9SZX8_ANGAN